MPAKPTPAKKSSGKTLADFRAVHDKNFVVPAKIKAGLEKLGAEGWEYEIEFMKTCGVSPMDFARFRDQYEEFYVELGSADRCKRVWAGSKALANKMREMV